MEVLARQRESRRSGILQKIKDIDEELLAIQGGKGESARCPRHLIHRRNTCLKWKEELHDELIHLSSRAGEDFIEDARDRSLLYIAKLEEEIDERSDKTDFRTVQQNPPECPEQPEHKERGSTPQLGSCAKRRNKRKANVRIYKDALERGELVVDRFKSDVGGFTVPTTVEHMDVCSDCSGRLLLDTQSRRLVCSHCCTESSGVHVFLHNAAKTKNGYQRVGYFHDLIMSETGVACPLNDAQLETIRQQLDKDKRKITTESVDDVCKRLGWNKLARFRTGIVERLTGKESPLKYSPAQYREVVDKFHIVNQSFDRLKSNGLITERQNFPYAFIHYKLVESTTWGKPLLGLFRLPDSRPLLKHQAIWSKICKDCQRHGFNIRYINTI